MKYYVTLVLDKKGVKALKILLTHFQGQRIQNVDTKWEKHGENDVLKDTYRFTNKVLREEFISTAYDILGEHLIDIIERRER